MYWAASTNLPVARDTRQGCFPGHSASTCNPNLVQRRINDERPPTIAERTMTDNSNLRVVERAYAAFQNGDVPTLMAQFSDDVSWNLPAIENVRISGARTGKANLADFFSTLAKDQEALLFAPTGFVAEGDLVVALGRYRWRVKMTGREIASDFAHVFTVTHGRIVRFQEFMDTAAFVAGDAGALTTV
jgi:uncharacterized protein